MADYATMDDLIGGLAVPEEDFTLPSGRTVRIRSLTRGEVLAGAGLRGAAEIELHVLTCGMVSPALSPEDAKRWQAAPAGSAAAMDCDAASGAIMRLSGMLGGATKSGRRGDDGPAGDEGGLRAGGEAAQDGSGDPGAAE